MLSLRRSIVSKTLVLTAIIMLAACVGAMAAEVDFEQPEKQMWGLARDKKLAELSERLAPGYQSVNEHGALGLEAALDALAKMDLSDFTLRNFKVTRTGPGAVVSYDCVVAESIDGKRMTKQKAPRCSVWIKTDKGWLTLMHANFNPLGKSSSEDPPDSNTSKGSR